MTAEMLPSLSRDEARDLLIVARTGIEAARHALTRLWHERAWVVLGYESWDALCDVELGGVRVALPRDERRQLVHELDQAGMSTRAIAPVVGVSQRTAAADVAAEQDCSPGPVLGLDGKSYNRRRPPAQPDPAPTPWSLANDRIGRLLEPTVERLIAALNAVEGGELDNIDDNDAGMRFSDRCVDRLDQLRSAVDHAQRALRPSRLRSVP